MARHSPPARPPSGWMSPSRLEHYADQVRDAVEASNDALIAYGRDHSDSREMGSTVTAALVVSGRAFIANVGDSRTYLFRDGKLTRITRDHSLVERLVEAGQIDPADVYDHPNRNLIYRSLSATTRSSVEVDIFMEQLKRRRYPPALQRRRLGDGARRADRQHPQRDRGYRARGGVAGAARERERRRGQYHRRPGPLRGSLREPRVMTLASGTVLANRYRVLARLGEGGMGSVYQVEDLKRPGVVYALKALLDDTNTSPEDMAWAAKRFDEEITLLSRLSHPRIPAFVDRFTEGGRRYFVMEYIPGMTLEQRQEQTHAPLPERDVLTLDDRCLRCAGLSA